MRQYCPTRKAATAAGASRRPPTLEPGILFRPGDRQDPGTTGTLPAFAIDLHLDEVIAPLSRGRTGDPLAARFLSPLRDPDAVAFRHEVFRDLEAPALRDALAAFATRMRLVDEHLAHASSIAHPLERHRWQVEAADVYRAAVADVADSLQGATPASRGLAAVTAGLRQYVSSDAFTTLVADTVLQVCSR